MITRRAFLASMSGFGLYSTSAHSLRRVNSPTASGCASSDDNANQIYYDNIGLIVQRDCDGGDTAQREGWYWFGTWVRASAFLNQPWPIPRRLSSFDQAIAQLEIGQTGTFRRHPKVGDPDDFSRDQTIPLVAAMAVWGDQARMQRFYHELRRRNWMAQNGRDLLGDPVNRNFVNRARGHQPPKVTDAAMLYAAAEARIVTAKFKGLDDVGDDLNLLVMLLLATLRKPCPGVDKAREHYAKNRPDNYGMFLESYRRKYGTDWDGKISKKDMCQLMDIGIGGAEHWKPDCPRILGALRWYFRAESRGGPGLATLYEPIVLKWFQ